ncbi:peptide-N4-(N-acetyl-beta-glucosaminyl)asparagine amidase A-like [Salvia hispanica]|uniref:peptide-N4-(N-acetyl-beta- glucosaminyl)asparagine amidase A-like n=1 Tax=Salvia hispanica TaxID=49212 RepID=UPI0020096968|nr:peptide-N4-(N-acetyl-beta-glucosaminyl)asparagine amidase A-like [Salvia hispanica]
MAPLILLLSLSLLLQPPPSAANLHKTAAFRSHSSSDAAAEVLTTYFEVTRPIPLPNTEPCSHSILHNQEFANTYSKPPILVNYTPKCRHLGKVVLEWTATCRGRQFDRIFGIWLGGVELLRSCTAEPTPAGIVWTVKKDVTRYRSLFLKEHNLSVYMGNIVDSTYTGIYHVNLTFHFYPTAGDVGGSPADLILPISRATPLNNGGAWFEIQNSTDVQGKELTIPNNAYRAVMEVYVSFHENDEFWYSNFPNEYISVNNLMGIPGNGPFREVVVRIDDAVVGAVWPFTVIYTGGVNPFFWRPVSAIGSFNLPTYDVEITPFLGKLLDSKPHSFGFSITNGLNVWFVDANLHLWLDSEWERTSGEVLEHTDSSSSPLSSSVKSRVSGSEGKFSAKFSRSVAASGRVESSYGVITTDSRQELRYKNKMELRKGGGFQVLEQVIKVRGDVKAVTASGEVFSGSSSRSKMGVRLYSEANESSFKGNVKLVLDEKWRERSEFGSRFGRLKNSQSAGGYLVVENKSLRGFGKTEQDYRYHGDDYCYFRTIRSANYTILHDRESSICKHI